MSQLRVCVVGASGYAGLDAVRILRRHPQVARVDTPDSAAGTDGVRPDTDVALLATPAEPAAAMASELIQRGVRVVDLSGAHRSGSQAAHERWYGFAHPHVSALESAVFGLDAPASELRRAPLVANPGCYANGILSALRPLQLAGWMSPGTPVHVTGISAVSGAGKKPTERTHFMAVAENLAPYRTGRTHQHTVEIERMIPIRLTFVPMVAPLRRGMLISGVLAIPETVTQADVDALPALDPLWRRVATAPQVADVTETPWILVHYGLDEQTHHLHFVTVLDNLMRGAASHAVMNMNAMFGLPLTLGLTD